MEEKLKLLETKIKEAISHMEVIVDNVEYQKNSGNYNVLAVTLDKVGGLDLDTIVEATNIINPIVDEYDFTSDSYILDVMSKERGESDE